MPRLFGRKDKKAKDAKPAESKSQRKISPSHRIVVYGADRKLHSNPNSSSTLAPSQQETADSSSPSPTTSSQDLISKLASSTKKAPKHTASVSSVGRRDSSNKVAAHKAFFEDLSQKSITNLGSQSPRRVSSPEKRRRDRDDPTTVGSNHSASNRVSVSVISPVSVSSSGGGTPTLTPSYSRGSRPTSDYLGSSSPSLQRMSENFESSGGGQSATEVGKERIFEGVDLPLPPLQTTDVRLREVDARRSTQGGGFGFILRKSYQPMPEEPDKTKLVHLIEPRSDYLGPLMTGDRIIEVNGEIVEDIPHEAVVDMIKASGESVSLKVASMPELVELNNRGALDVETFERNTVFRKSGKAKQGTGG